MQFNVSDKLDTIFRATFGLLSSMTLPIASLYVSGKPNTTIFFNQTEIICKDPVQVFPKSQSILPAAVITHLYLSSGPGKILRRLNSQMNDRTDLAGVIHIYKR
jgi:hypothetical protein